MTKVTTEDSFNIEVLKLLLQLAWSDDAIAPQEVNFILGAARTWGVPEKDVADLKRYLEEYESVPAPDLALLRGRPSEVMEAACALIATDGRIHASEKAMLAELRIILDTRG
jgi:tellurite resistance protein